MTSDPQPTQGSSGGFSFTAESIVQIVDDTRLSIDWSRLFRGGIGGVIFAVWEGLIGIPVAITTAIDRVVTGLLGLVESVMLLVFDVPLSSIETIWTTANVEVFGVVAQPVTLVASLLTLGVLAWVTYQWLEA